MNSWRLDGLGIVALAAVVCLGCSRKDTAQVSGRVQYEGGAPIKAGIKVIRFEPTSDSTATVRKTASANIADDGSFTLYSRKPGDGVYRGKYAVTFTILTAATSGENITRSEYLSAETTPFQVEIDGDKTDLLYEIKPK